MDKLMFLSFPMLKHTARVIIFLEFLLFLFFFFYALEISKTAHSTYFCIIFQFQFIYAHFQYYQGAEIPLAYDIVHAFSNPHHFLLRSIHKAVISWISWMTNSLMQMCLVSPSVC